MISNMNFWERILYLLQEYGTSYLKGAGTTLVIALVSTAIGCLIGFIVGIIQTIPEDKERFPVKKDRFKDCKDYFKDLCGSIPWNADDRSGSVYLLWSCTDF